MFSITVRVMRGEDLMPGRPALMVYRRHHSHAADSRSRQSHVVSHTLQTLRQKGLEFHVMIDPTAKPETLDLLRKVSIALRNSANTIEQMDPRNVKRIADNMHPDTHRMLMSANEHSDGSFWLHGPIGDSALATAGKLSPLGLAVRMHAMKT